MIRNANTSTLDKHIKFFNSFDISGLLLTVANEAIKEVKERVSDGIASDGSIMDTKSADRSGRYNRRYANIRQSAGLQTSKRDLNFTGDMVNDYKIIEKRENYVAGGFDTKNEADKAEYNEIYMGVKAFDLSKEEEENIVKKVNKGVNDLIRLI